MTRSRLLAASIVLVGVALSACAEDNLLRAKRVERQDELIGGPSARGKLGDYLIENDRIRVVVGGPGPGWAAGVFGGTLLDVDLRRWQPEFAGGHGLDHFQESFPLANLLVPNPADPTKALKLGDPLAVQDGEAAVRVLADGSDGREAVVRVEGHAAYFFDVLQFLNRGFLDSLTIPAATLKGLVPAAYQDIVDSLLGDKPLDLAGIQALLPQLAGIIPLLGEKYAGLKPLLEGLNLFALLNRLQLSFEFTTDYVLRPGEPFLTMRTTVTLSPPLQALVAGCGPVVCSPESIKDCPDGPFAMVEVNEKLQWMSANDTPLDYDYKRMCPVCECAKAQAAMPTFNESRDFFILLLGQPDKWKDPAWKGSIVGGDFLFFGGNASVFGQGFGFDIDRKIYEQMWQGVGTMGSPFVLDWVAATGDGVSYAWVTKNPNERRGFDCPSYRIAVTRTSGEDAFAAALEAAFAFGKTDAATKARQLVVDRKPVVLVPDVAVPPADQRGDFAAWEKGVLDGPQGQAVLAGLAGTATRADLALLPRHDCMASRLLVPLFSTSATAVLTHFSEGDGYAEETLPDGTKRMRDAIRSYTFERYLAVGDGDVASAVRVAYDIRGTARGEVQGVVFENGSMNPIVGADVFALADPRTDPAAPVPASFREYRKLAQAAWGHSGVMSQMETDGGVMPSWTGEFSGPLPPGAYFLVARTPDRGLSPLVPVTIAEGRTTVAHLSLPAAGRIEYRVQDQGGMASPARITFVRTDAAGDDLDWDGSNEPELGDPRYDHGIVKHEFTMNGHGAVGVPPGEYDVYASRGIEFGVAVAHVEVRPGANAPAHLVLAREVDTTGWVSADLHVHSGASVDAGLPHSLRVKAAVAEGLEFFAATDHDYVSWFLAHVLRLGVEQFLKVMPGVETSPLEYGHFNGFPMQYDDTKWPNRDAPPWAGRRLEDVWREMRERSSAPADAFIVEVNHPRDGMMGYFGQIGMKGYSLERKTPGMETCAAPLERAPCDFEAFELLNGKNFQYLHTPTVVEEADYYRCMSAIIASRNAADFPQKDGAGGLCADLQKGPAGCDAAKAAAAAADRTAPVDDATAAAVVLADHCRWHEAFRAEMARCSGATPIDCKRIALEALKFLSVRYMVERTPSENDRYFETTAATDVGCSLEDACTECVCAAHPECCQDPPEPGQPGTGTGWTPACEAACRAECPASLDRPCTDRFEPIEDWFAFLDAGFDKAVVANSDSHGLQKEIGLPRNFVASPTDSPFAIDADDLSRAVRARRVILSSGPFLDFEVAGASGASAGPGETLDASGGGDLAARLVIQTPSWFKVDRVEIYRNSKLEKRIFPDRPKEEVVDLDTTVALGRPAEDSWYVVLAYGLNDPDQLSPVYKREAYGNILISTIISLAAQQILSSFGSVLDAIGGADAIGQLLGGVELPDSFPNLPWATTNAIKVDVDGGGWRPPKARVAADGSFDLPPFCTRPCAPQAGPDGAPTRTTCGENQVCIPDAASPQGGMCGIPVPKGCVGLQKSGG